MWRVKAANWWLGCPELWGHGAPSTDFFGKTWLDFDLVEQGVASTRGRLKLSSPPIFFGPRPTRVASAGWALCCPPAVCCLHWRHSSLLSHPGRYATLG